MSFAPKTLMPKGIDNLGVKSFTDEKGLDGCDIVMMLRLQNERMQGIFSSIKERILRIFWTNARKT